MISINCALLEENGAKGIMPFCATIGSVGYDLALPRDVVLHPHLPVSVPLLVAFDIPEPYYIEIGPRSSLLLRHNVHSPVSYIDTDYKKGVHAILMNVSSSPIKLQAGMRVLQAIVKIKIDCIFTCVDTIADNGRGGMGSTGC
jgi:deoxyuridine 5'-triphosphate nucleotidohydrolase